MISLVCSTQPIVRPVTCPPALLAPPRRHYILVYQYPRHAPSIALAVETVEAAAAAAEAPAELGALRHSPNGARDDVADVLGRRDEHPGHGEERNHQDVGVQVDI